jgi:hypothetical protein
MFKASVEYVMVPHAGEAAGGRIGFEENFGIDNLGIRWFQHLPSFSTSPW